MASSSSTIAIGKKVTAPECQLLLCLEMSAHDEAFVSPQRATLLPEAYTTCYAKVNAIISDVGNQPVDSILDKYYSSSAACGGGGGATLVAKKHEFTSLDSCLARMSLSSYSHTTVWTLVCQNERQFFCLVANDQLPFCALYAPIKGEYITFADGNLESARNYLVEQFKLSEEKAISAIVCSVEIKKEPKCEAKVSVLEEATLEAKIPVLSEDTPQPPPTAVVQEEAPAAPKKKVVRKRTAPTAAGGGEEPEAKKSFH